MNSKNYWKRRAILLEQLLNTRADATVQQISRLYGLAQEQIFGSITKPVGFGVAVIVPPAGIE